MQEPGRRPDGGGKWRCVCQLVGLLYASCRLHGKRVRWALHERKHQVGRLRWYFPGTPIGARFLSGDELLWLADRIVDRERRAAVTAVRPAPGSDRSLSATPVNIQGRAGRIIPKRCEP